MKERTQAGPYQHQPPAQSPLCSEPSPRAERERVCILYPSHGDASRQAATTYFASFDPMHCRLLSKHGHRHCLIGCTARDTKILQGHVPVLLPAMPAAWRQLIQVQPPAAMWLTSPDPSDRASGLTWQKVAPIFSVMQSAAQEPLSQWSEAMQSCMPSFLWPRSLRRCCSRTSPGPGICAAAHKSGNSSRGSSQGGSNRGSSTGTTAADAIFLRPLGNPL